MLTNPAMRRLFGATWEDEAKRIVAQFRATHDLWAGDPAFRDLLQRLAHLSLGVVGAIFRLEARRISLAQHVDGGERGERPSAL